MTMLYDLFNRPGRERFKRPAARCSGRIPQLNTPEKAPVPNRGKELSAADSGKKLSTPEPGGELSRPDLRQVFDRMMARERALISEFENSGEPSLLHKLSRIQEDRAKLGRQLKIGLLKND